jgi:hypothetical protein
MASDEEWLERIERDGVVAFDGRRGLEVDGVGSWCAIYEPGKSGRWFVCADVQTYGGHVTEGSTGHAPTAEAALAEAREGIARIQARENRRLSQGAA